MPELDFSFIKNKKLRENIERDFSELLKLKPAKTPKAVAVMCGSILEALLYQKMKGKKNIKQYEQKFKQTFDKWTLGRLIRVAAEPDINILPPLKTIKLRADIIKDNRDLLHPGNALKTSTSVSQLEAEESILHLKIILKSLFPKDCEPLLNAFANQGSALAPQMPIQAE